jgi:ribosome biogenesis protein NSA1
VENTQMATSMATTPTTGQIAIGGRERESTIIDIYTGQQVWKAKNLAPDPQTLLQQPVWSTALTFLSDSLLLSGTAYKQVRLYDIRSNSRRPVSYTPEGLLEHRVTALCSVDEHNIAVGDAAGSLIVLDLRKHLGKSKKSTITSVPRFVGPVGSIRQIVCHPTKPWLACVGLDRMLRVYSTRSRRQMDCVYLKQRVNSLLFCADEEWPLYDEIEIGDTDINAEDEVEDYVDSDEESGEGANANEESSDSDDDDAKLEGSDDDDGSSEEEDSDDDDGDSDSSEEPEMDEDEEPETGKDELFQSKKKKPRR